MTGGTKQSYTLNCLICLLEVVSPFLSILEILIQLNMGSLSQEHTCMQIAVEQMYCLFVFLYCCRILISLKDLCFVMLMKQLFEVLMDAEWRIRFFGLFQMLRLYETTASTLSCMVWSHCVSIPNFVLCRISGQHSDA